MTSEITIVFGILLVAVVLFVTERVRVDIVALMVLVTLPFTNLVTPSEAMSGFANLAVVPVWAVLILSGGLARTGVASIIGHQILRIAGSGEARLIAIIMLTAGVLSGFMNDSTEKRASLCIFMHRGYHRARFHEYCHVMFWEAFYVPCERWTLAKAPAKRSRCPTEEELEDAEELVGGHVLS